MSIKIPAFNEASYKTDISDKKSTVTVIKKAAEASFHDYTALFEKEGFTKKQSYTNGTHSFAALSKGDEGVFLNYFGGTDELYILVEEDCRYFDFKDDTLPHCVKPQITQLNLDDFGMSYIIRLSDGRFILIDGGREFETDSDRLYAALCEQSPHEKPVIAAWMLTHPHCDHFNAFITFAEKYAACVTVNNVLYNFPEKDDIEHYSALTNRKPQYARDTSPAYNIPLFFDAAEKFGAALITARTGQIYNIGDAVCEILASMDDTIHRAGNVNAISLVMRMELGGQVILFPADMTISDAALNEKYADYLKCDIMQVPHHGFMSGDPKVLIEFYKIAQPKVCLIPVSNYVGYSCFSTFMEATDFLFRCSFVEEMITGDTTRTLVLPYTADADGKSRLELSYLRGRDDCGAQVWVFNDLFSENEDDAVFTVLNMAYIDAVLDINVYTEDKAQKVRHIKAVIPGDSMKKINIFSENDVDGDSDIEPINFSSLKKTGKPQNTCMCVRVRSSIPVVVSNKNRKADYISTNR